MTWILSVVNTLERWLCSQYHRWLISSRHRVIERFLFDLEMKTREQNRNNNLTEVEWFDWFIERTQTRAAFGWLSEHSGEKPSCPWIFYEWIDTSLWRHTATRLANRCLLHIRVFFGGKSKSPCFDLFIHWQIKQITNTYGNHFSRSYENRSILFVLFSFYTFGTECFI